MATIKEVNLDKLEEKYGVELAKKIKKDIEYSNKNSEKFTVEIIHEFQEDVRIVFCTRNYTQIYDVDLSSKTISSKNFIGSITCKKVLDIMNQL